MKNNSMLKFNVEDNFSYTSKFGMDSLDKLLKKKGL
jgi:hypothetical protein